MDYKVTIGYKTYFFNDRDEALDFAEIAAYHQVNNDSVSISLVQEGTDEERD